MFPFRQIPPIMGPLRSVPTNIEFTTTRWSLVVASARPSGVGFRPALEELTRQYRDAIVVFISNYYRCGGDEAEDVAQEFIVRWIERGFANVTRDRGRFRSYLRGALRHFVQNWRRDKQTQRRGGLNAEPGRLDDLNASDMKDETTLSPEQVFDATYRRELFHRALQAMADEYAADGCNVRMTIFRRYYIDALGTKDQPTYKSLADEFEVSETDVTNWLAHARTRLRYYVTALVRDSVSDAFGFQREMDALGRPMDVNP